MWKKQSFQCKLILQKQNLFSLLGCIKHMYFLCPPPSFLYFPITKLNLEQPSLHPVSKEGEGGHIPLPLIINKWQNGSALALSVLLTDSILLCLNKIKFIDCPSSHFVGLFTVKSHNPSPKFLKQKKIHSRIRMNIPAVNISSLVPLPSINKKSFYLHEEKTESEPTLSGLHSLPKSIPEFPALFLSFR